jgi:hypothetical protein
MAEIIYPEINPNIQNWCYWAGNYSIMRIRGNIENFVFDFIKNYTIKTNQNISLLITSCDGIEKEEEYLTVLQRINMNNIKIIGVLCTRSVYKPNILYLPLDDDIFSNGLKYILKDIPKVSWDDKKSVVFWRGGTSGGYPSIRINTVYSLHNYPNTDVKLTYWCDWQKNMPIPNCYFGDRCNLDKHFHYKYIMIIDGNCIASNHQWVFGSGSVPIMITHPDNNWWFKEYLKPMENYVPINYDLSDLKEKIDWLINNDDQAKKIMENAMILSETYFSHKGQTEHLKSKISDIIETQIINNI